jgi:hypothetical protein
MSILTRIGAIAAISLLGMGVANAAPPTGAMMATSKPAEQPYKPPPPISATNEPVKTTPTVQLKPGEAPLIEFDGTVFDAGRVRSGVQIEHDFWFTNKGTGPLEILEVRPGCGCTKAGEHDRIVQPGETGKIPIRVATVNTNGALNKSVTVTTNSPSRSQVVLQVKADLWQAIAVVPNDVLFGRLSSADVSDDVLVKKVTIHNNMDLPSKMTDVTISPAAFRAQLQEIKPGRQYELTVRAVQPLPAGPISGFVEMNTGLVEHPRLVIHVTAFMTPDVEVTPSIVTMALGRRATTQRQLYVKNNTKNPIKVSDLSCTSKALNLSMRETSPGMSFLINIDVPLDYKAPPEGDRLTLKTDNVNNPLLTVNIVDAAPALSSKKDSIMTLSDFQQLQQQQKGGATPPKPGDVGRSVVPVNAATPVKSAGSGKK